MPLDFSFGPGGELIVHSTALDPSPLSSFHEELLLLPPQEFVTQGDQVHQAGTLGEETKMIHLYRQKMQRSLFTFNYTIMGGDNLLQQVPHGLFCDFLQAVPPRRKMLLAPRGHLKTTLAGGQCLHFFIQPGGENIYFAKQLGALSHNEGRSTRVLLSSKSLDLASDRLQKLKLLLETNKLFYGFWPHIFYENPSKQSRVWNNEEIVFQRDDIFVEPSIKCIGVGGTITGYHFNVHMHDDLIDIRDRASPTTMKTAFDWFVASRALLDNIQDSLEITTGTHWANNDVYTLIRENDQSVETRVYSCLLRGSFNKNQLSPDAAPLWPQVFPLSLIEQLAQPEPYGVGDLFPLCYLNDPYHANVVDFDSHDLRWYDLEQDTLTFEHDERDGILNRTFGQVEHPFMQNLVRGHAFDKVGYGLLREQLRDRSSKIYFNGR